jgi:hypothetical protein
LGEASAILGGLILSLSKGEARTVVAPSGPLPRAAAPPAPRRPAGLSSIESPADSKGAGAAGEATVMIRIYVAIAAMLLLTACSNASGGTSTAAMCNNPSAPEEQMALCSEK